MTIMQTAWIIYAAGALGCCLATWWMFLWAWRFVRYSAVVTVMTLLFTPYAIDPQTMQMAPAIYTLIFNGVALGLEEILPLIKVMVGIWLIGVILVLIFVLLTRNSGRKYHKAAQSRSQTERSPAGRNRSEQTTSRQTSRNNYQASAPAAKKSREQPRKEYFPMDNLSREERQAREEMLQDDIPMRAIRD